MPRAFRIVAVAGLLLLMFVLAGGTVRRESATVDEIAHVGAGLSYLQRFDLRLNAEHPPLAKAIAALPLLVVGTRADYAAPAWAMSNEFFPAYMAQWMFGDAVLGRWNDWKTTLFWARLPMLLLTLLLGWMMYRFGSRLGGAWGGLLCLLAFVSTPAFLVFGPLVITDLPVTLFSLAALWQLGEIWKSPSRRNSLLFGLALGAALLSKFTGLLLLPIVLLLFIQTRFWPSELEPRDKAERKSWRRTRWKAVLLGLLAGVLLTYAVYFVLSWNQSNDVLNRVGSGPWAWIVRRPLMPLWLYLRGILLMLLMGSRSTFLFGHSYPHGVPYYFPLVFLLKSTPGFLLLLLLTAILGVICRVRGIEVIPKDVRSHWRVLMIGFFTFLAVCLLSRLDISIRHFMMPIALLILMLAPLPNMIAALSQGRRRLLLEVTTIAGAAACIVPMLLSYPHLFPYINSLALGHTAYYVLNDSNVTWNEALPEVESFVQERGLSEIRLDWASLSDPATVVPQERDWDCQSPASSDAGKWVAVAAVSILDNRNCGYLQQYPHRELGGGAFYAFRLPAALPAPGQPGGPPVAAERRIMWGMPMDLRSWAVNVERHPETLQAEMAAMMKRYQEMGSRQNQPKR